MPAPKKRKKPVFINCKETGCDASISFEVVGEDEQASKAHSFEATVHYFESGKGRPLILVHGIGQSLFAWHNNIEFFAANGFRVIALDLPGYGYSTHPNIYYTVEETTKIIKAFMDSLGISNASIAGFSTSAISAAVLAQQHPEIVDKLILVSPGGPNDAYPFLMRALTTKPGQILFRMRFTPQTMENLLKELYFNKPMVTQNVVDQYFEPYKNKDVRDTLIMSMLHFENPFDASGLHGIKKDTIVFSGQNDPIHSEKTAQMFANIPGAKHRRIRNCGHFVNEEKAEVFNSETLEFLNQTEAERVFV